MSLLSELEADLKELQHLLSTAQRKRTQELLRADIESIKLNIEKEKALTPQPVSAQGKTEEAKESTTKTAVDFLTITKYSFDQEGKLVKVYFSLDEIGKLDPSNIKLNVTKNSFELCIFGYKNANWKFAIKQLHASVDPEKCKFVQKTNTLIIRLQKEKDGSWPQLNYKEAAFKPDMGVDKDADPSASLMNMMKNLYQEGDDDMKRTIAQAWQKSQDEKDGDLQKRGAF